MLSKEFKIGVIALVSGLLLYYGFNYLKGIDFFSESNKYYVLYSNVQGLNKSNPVLVNGLAVGRVSDIRLLQDQNRIVVELDIDESVQLGDSTVAVLANTDLLGSKGIVLNIGPVDVPLAPRDTLISEKDAGIEAILEEAQPVANNLNITITRINEILIGLKGSGVLITSALGKLDTTLAEVNELLAANQVGVRSLVDSTNMLLSNINSKVDQLGVVMEKAGTTLDTYSQLELDETITSLQILMNSLNSTVAKLNEGQGTMGKLMTNDSLYNNLNQALVDLDQLIIHFNQYPKDFMKPLGRKHNKLEGLKDSK